MPVCGFAAKMGIRGCSVPRTLISRWQVDRIMALKRTSEPFIISTSVDESAANTFTQAQVSVNLNPLDQEVLLVLAADIDAFAPDVVAGTNTAQSLSISTTGRTTVGSISDSNVIASQRIDVKTDGVNHVVFDRLQAIGPSSDKIDYISILATNNFFLQTQGVNNAGAKGGSARLWVVRAKADSATYAALVNSELLSE